MGLNEKDLLWLELSLTPEVQPRHLRGLLARFESIEAAFAANILELGAAGLPPGAAAAVSRRAGRDSAEGEALILERENIELIAFDSQLYPSLLKQVHDPPIVLFAMGSLTTDDSRAVALVGSRSSTAYGNQVAHRLAGDLAAQGVTVVSGLARGIDQSAHNGALEVGGRTVAVLGSGLGKIYPTGSQKLVERIAGSGAVITEFSRDVPPSKSTFPQRNRIISGMSHIVVIVEASERSGALITARLALEQDRELLAVPGPITSRQSIGANYIIKRGAKLVQRAEDIVEELPADVRSALKKKAPERAGATGIDGMERAVLDAVSVDTPTHVDIIARRSGLSVPELTMVLLGLEMKSLVRQLPGMEYLKAI